MTRLTWAETVTTLKCRAEENVDLVNDLIQSQEYMPQTHRTIREISRETEIWLRCYKITTVSLVAAFY